MDEALRILIQEGGLVGSVLVLSLAGNIAQYRSKELMHKETRDNDRSVYLELFKALEVVRQMQDHQRSRD